MNKFDVGNWVRLNPSIPSEYEVGKIESFENDEYVVNDCIVYEKQMEYWQPNKDEICWSLKYKELVKCTENHEGFISFIMLSGGTDSNHYDEFEPLLGKLPSFAKDFE